MAHIGGTKLVGLNRSGPSFQTRSGLPMTSAAVRLNFCSSEPREER
jgi:hypothetical protein